MKKIILMALIAFTFSASAAGKKVLYFTHEPGKWHKYAPQKEIFIKVAEKAGWDLTVSTGDHDPQIVKLRDPKLTDGYDAVVYNFCFAKSNDLEAVSNVIKQTREKGVPAMVIHCTMHSFWSTFKNGTPVGKNNGSKAVANSKVLADWNKANPSKEFPIWGDFTGIASTSHGPKTPIQVDKCCDHSATKSIASTGYKTPDAELYNNFYVLDTVQPLLKGTQIQMNKQVAKKIAKGQKLNDKEQKMADNPKKAEATVMWVVPQGKSKVLGLSLGHGESEWKQPEFQSLLTDGVNFLLEK